MANFDFTDLILLVGTNPLPNYVVGKFFLGENKGLERVWLVCSANNTFGQSSTRPQAERLMHLLNKEAKKELITSKNFISLSNVGNANDIRNDLKGSKEGLFRKLQDAKSQKVHLNYTGGTQAMGVHSYMLVLDEFKSNSSFSYLDGRTFRIVGDDGSVYNKEKELREIVSIKLDDLIELHGFKKKKESNGQEIDVYKPLLDSFTNLIESGDLAKYYEFPKPIDENLFLYNWEEYFSENFEVLENRIQLKNIPIETGWFRKLFIDKKGSIIKEAKNFKEEKLLNFRFNETFTKILNSIPDEWNFYNKDNRNLLKSKKAIEENKIFKFLDGEWLELYVYKILKEKLSSNFKVHLNFIVNKSDWGNTDFELDIPVLYGYQLTTISCTTDEKISLCKSKAFEVIQRAKQISGDEAKTILITRLENSESLQIQLEKDTGMSKKQILVLCSKDLSQEILYIKISNFIKEIA